MDELLDEREQDRDDDGRLLQVHKEKADVGQNKAASSGDESKEGLRTMVSRTAIEVRYGQPHVPGRFEQEKESDSQTMKKMGMEKRSWVILKVSC
jgi:hypothetical protein